MEFSYYNNNKQLKTFYLNVNDNWANIAKDSSILTSIFSEIDDGDMIIDEKEVRLFGYILNKANELVKNTSKTLNLAGLENIKKEIDEGSLNIQSLELESVEKFDEQFYSLEAIKERYPSNKYRIEEPFVGRITVWDKNTDKWVLTVDKKESVWIRDNENNKTGIQYNEEGNLNPSLEIENIAKKINAEVSSKNKFGLTTTGENLFKYVKELNADNIKEVLKYYKNNFDENIEEAINKEWGLDGKLKKDILEHIERTLEIAEGFNPNYKIESTKISNEYYEGDDFSIKTNADKITVINNSNNCKYYIDLNVLTSELPLEERVKLKSIIQKLPAEVLVDLSIELDNSIKRMSESEIEENPDTAGYYRACNEITLNFDNLNTDLTLIHELGHALDYTGRFYNTSSILDNENFNKIYQEELNNFRKKQDTYNQDNVRYSGAKYDTFGASNYATYKEGEMFAECYTLLMSGFCNSNDVILDNFPKTLEAVKQHIKQIRTLPSNVRR